MSSCSSSKYTGSSSSGSIGQNILPNKLDVSSSKGKGKGKMPANCNPGMCLSSKCG